MKTFGLFLLISVCFSEVHLEAPSNWNNATLEQKAYNQFALELLIETSGLLDSQRNLVLSPFSVWSILALLTEGSYGSTNSQLESALHHYLGNKTTSQRYQVLDRILQTGKDSAVELEKAIALVTDRNRPIYQSFEDLVETKYKANIIPVNFNQISKAALEINSWVAKITRNRITEIINEGDLKDPQLVLLNAVYFKGKWKEPFNESDTVDQDFLDETGKVIAKVPTMKRTARYIFGYVPEVEAHMLVLPYEGDKFSMVVAVPQRTVPLLQMLEKIKLASMMEVLRQLEQIQGGIMEDVQVQLPRFIVRSDFILNSVLTNLGVTDAFTDKANFHAISRQDLRVSRFIHKAEIEVNEKGTTASAATGAVFVEKMMPSVFRANRPFAYFIIENEQKIVLFAGRVANPLGG